MKLTRPYISVYMKPYDVVELLVSKRCPKDGTLIPFYGSEKLDDQHRHYLTKSINRRINALRLPFKLRRRPRLVKRGGGLRTNYFWEELPVPRDPMEAQMFLLAKDRFFLHQKAGIPSGQRMRDTKWRVRKDGELEIED